MFDKRRQESEVLVNPKFPGKSLDGSWENVSAYVKQRGLCHGPTKSLDPVFLWGFSNYFIFNGGGFCN